MRAPVLPLFAACLSLAACASNSIPSTGVDARVAEQNALLEEYYQANLKAHPEQATAYGDYRYNDRLDDRSLAALGAEHASDQNFLAHLKALSTAGFSEQDAISHELLLRTLQQHIDDYDFKEYEMPVSQMDGPHVHLADLPLSVPFGTLKPVSYTHLDVYKRQALYALPAVARMTGPIAAALAATCGG